MQNQLEKYISKIEDQLVMLPTKQRREEVHEIRLHLERMIEENIARGCDADDAVMKALEQFGSARKVGQELRYSSSSTPHNWKMILVKCQVLTIALGLINLILFYQLTNSGSDPSKSALFYWVFGCSMVVGSFVNGWTLETIAPDQTKIPVMIFGFFMACGYTILNEIITKNISQNPLMSFMLIIMYLAGLAGVITRYWQIKKRTVASN